MQTADQDRFRTALAMVMATFPAATFDPITVQAYWSALAPSMTIEEFEMAARNLMLDEREFPPRPGHFLAAISPSEEEAEAKALDEWGEALRPVNMRSNAGRGSVTAYGFSAAGRLAWNAVGGDRRVLSADIRDLDFIRDRFVSAYKLALQKPDILLAEQGRGRLSAGRREGPKAIADAIPPLAALQSGGEST